VRGFKIESNIILLFSENVFGMRLREDRVELEGGVVGRGRELIYCTYIFTKQ
jgi:hypothetical protein